MLVLLVVVGGAVGTGGWYAYTLLAEDEGSKAARARKDFEDGKYPQAATTFNQLVKYYPESAQFPEYRFLADLCNLLLELGSAASQPQEILDHTSQFAKEQNADLLKTHGRRLGSTFVTWTRSMIDAVKQNANLPTQLLDRGQEVVADVRRIPDAITNDEARQLDQAFQLAYVAIKERELAPPWCRNSATSAPGEAPKRSARWRTWSSSKHARRPTSTATPRWST